MPNTSSDHYTADLLPTHNSRGQPTGARMRQAYVEDAEDEGDRYYYNPVHQSHPEHSNAAPAYQHAEWHGIELDPILDGSAGI